MIYMATDIDGGNVFITLTMAQYGEGIRCGDKRYARALEKHRKGKNKQPLHQTLFDNQIGCLGERAVLVWKNLPLSLMDFYPDDLREESGIKPADFGLIDVKAKQKTGKYMLLQPDDPDHYYYLLTSVNLDDLVVIIHGWVLGSEAKQKARWGDFCHTGRPCFCYPVREKNDGEKKSHRMLYTPHTLPVEAWGDVLKVKQ